MNDHSKEDSAPTNLEALLLVNHIEPTQSLTLQNTNKEEPIQLRVDPVTDYTALGITVIVSIITAFVSAFITIKIVTKSNEKLIENEKFLQKNALLHDKEKELSVLTSKNRQDWINTLRIDISEIISQSTNIIHNLRATLQVSHTESRSLEHFSIFISSYQQVSSIIAKVELFLNIDKPAQNDLQKVLNLLKDDLMKFCNANLAPDHLFYEKSVNVLQLKNNISTHINDISKYTKIIIKEEWQKTKSGV